MHSIKLTSMHQTLPSYYFAWRILCTSDMGLPDLGFSAPRPSAFIRAVLTFSPVQFWVLAIPSDSPLRNTPSLFWTVRTNDEGTGRKDGFHALVNKGKIKLVAPARAVGYAADGQSVVLEDGRKIRAGAVVLATGFKSSWNAIFDEGAMEDIGLGRRATHTSVSGGEWAYTTLPDLHTPSSSSKQGVQAPSLYRGIVPAKNILRRNLAVNGAIVRLFLAK